MSNRPSRREMKQDKFVEDVSIAYSFASDHRKQLFLIIGGVIALAGSIWGGIVWYGNRQDNASLALGNAIRIAEATVSPTPAAGALGPQYKTEQEKTAAAKAAFEGVVKDYGRSNAADVANLYLARMAVNRGESDAARTSLQKFIDEHPKHLLASGARVSLYELDLFGGKSKELVATLEKELGATEKTLPPDVLLNLLARAYDGSGQPEKARDTWRRIVTEFPDSPYAAEAQRGAS